MQLKLALVLLPFLVSQSLSAPLAARAAARSFAQLSIRSVQINPIQFDSTWSPQSPHPKIHPSTTTTNTPPSGGKAGTAQAEALAKLPISTSDLAAVSAADLSTLQTERETAEAAETDAFNPAVDAASGAAATALQNGKIKNKVLKLTFEVAALQVQQAQGKDTADKIAEEQKKLDTNIALDEKAAGQVSRTVDFTG